MSGVLGQSVLFFFTFFNVEFRVQPRKDLHWSAENKSLKNPNPLHFLDEQPPIHARVDRYIYRPGAWN